jgi:hypothetical protein
MNLTTPTTIGELRRLVAAADDHAGEHMLWIDTSGEVHLTPLAVQAARTGAGIHTPAARLRFAAFAPGDGMVGPQAARNDRLIGELYFSILHHWLHAGDAPPGPLDVELDEFERHAPWASAASGAVWQRPASHHAGGGARS